MDGKGNGHSTVTAQQEGVSASSWRIGRFVNAALLAARERLPISIGHVVHAVEKEEKLVDKNHFAPRIPANLTQPAANGGRA